MNKLIKGALRKPITVVVAIIATLFFSVLTLFRIPVDIFPNLNLPTIYVIQPYGGMAPDQMDGFIATRYQDHFLYVSGIKDMDIKSIQGLTVMRLEFYPDADMAQAAGEIAINIARAKSYMPEGTVPPQVVRFDASSVPVGQLVFESSTRSLNEIQDFAASRVRPMFSKIAGVSSPPPFGGNQRSIVIKVDPNLMKSYKLSAEEVVKMIAANNQPSPAGNIRIGDKTLMTPVNSLINKPEEFLNIPVKLGNGPTVFVKDIATVEDAADVTVSYALVNGKRAVYIPVVKKADASTLEAVSNIKNALPKLQDAVPEDVKISFEFDQSAYVVHALKSLITEGVLGALLTGLVVFLFLRDWRSVIIVVVTIPVSVLSAVLMLHLFGQTINTMTLSGLALAIGILVDESTVTIENIHRHLEMHKTKAQAIWDACKEIAFPKFLILLSILAVFAPAFVMEGIPRSMFLPLSLSVGFAMISSFLLSQTFVPVLSNWLLKNEAHHEEEDGFFGRFKERYRHILKNLLGKKRRVVSIYLVSSLLVAGLAFTFLGTDILPKSNTKQFQLRLRAPDGTRIERTEEYTLKVLDLVKEQSGGKVDITSSYVGTVPSSYGTSSIYVFNRGPHEAVLQVALSPKVKGNMDEFREQLRKRIASALPDVQVSFEPIELVEKIMSQGSSTPIEISVAAKDILEANSHAKKIVNKLQQVSFLKDVQIAQPMDYPVMDVNINRERAGQLGITSTQVAKSLVAATSSSRFVEKNLWLDNKKGQAYQVQVQIPEHLMNDAGDISSISVKNGEAYPLLADVATVHEKVGPGEYDRSGSNRLVTITANMYQKDLGTAYKAVQKVLKDMGDPPRGVIVETKGQTKLLNDTLKSLQTGLLVAIVIIFLLFSANFQSFKLAIVILSTVPAVLAGSLSLLWLTGATLNLQSYMGLIMSVGVSIANSLLLVTSAEEARLENHNAKVSAIEAGLTRIRPIIMTSLAMIAGMIPMALGLGEGGEQVAPLGQAVIGGLVASTVSTLLILPVVFNLAQQKSGIKSPSLDPEDPQSIFYNKQEIYSYEEA